ncbi:MAG TPA: alanine/ornithine racemase family PLP-dependent enzyme [Bacteroidales bacterium]|nr:alanine/ornithine racemase family PLP-dependent enzyme [Bacteroidales bacterium]
MAHIELNRKNLRENYTFLNKMFKKHKIEWGVVTKVLCGNKLFIKEVLDLGVREAHDSRISNLKALKSIDPGVQTVYIKPPAKRAIPSLVKYADVSFNTSFATIKMISDEAGRQNKLHKIIIMVEMGDLREGVLGDNLMNFYSRVFELPNIEIIGIGANLNCLNGVMPTHDKLIQLSLYEQLIEAKFDKKIEWVSGGSSVTIPLLFKKLIPKGVNHMRIGETLFRGVDLFEETTIPGMHKDVFKLHAEIIELYKKPKVPIGEMGLNVAGETPEINESDYGKSSYRAILDIGLLDIDLSNLIPDDETHEFSGASSDMIVLDLDKNEKGYKVGDIVSFGLTYMGILAIMNSNYITKAVV